MNIYYLQEQRLQHLAGYAERQIQRGQFAGVAWSIRHHDKIVSSGVSGHADHARANPLTDDTLFRLYSMTKPVVSVCCLQLVESGQLRLDDPVSRWIPAFASQQVLSASGSLKAVERPVTIEDLLTHRSGLSYDFLPDCPVAECYRQSGLASDGQRSLEQLVALLAEHPLAFQPGERWYYSYSTDVLAHVLECVLDRPLAQCLDDYLFAPLSMHETGFQVSDEKHARVADMFGQRELGEVDSGDRASNTLQTMDVQESYPLSSTGSFSRGGIGLFSTIADYRHFMGVLIHGCAPDGRPVLSEPMLDMLWANRLSIAQMPICIGKKAFAGYGWGLTGRVMSDLSQSCNLSSVGEGGWAGAASTYFWVDRRRQLSGVVMAQYLGSAVPLGPDMQAITYGALCKR